MKGRFYTADEDRVLLAKAGRLSLTTLAHRLGRSPEALRVRLRQRHGWRGANSAKAEAIRAAGMSRAEVARALGVTGKTVGHWCRCGVLRERKTLALRRTYSSIDAEAVSTFLRDGGALLDVLQPTDLAWREIVAEIRAELSARFTSPTDLADVLGLSVRTLPYLRNRHGMPGPAIKSRGTFPSWYDRAELRAWIADHPQYQTQRTRLL